MVAGKKTFFKLTYDETKKELNNTIFLIIASSVAGVAAAIGYSGSVLYFDKLVTSIFYADIGAIFAIVFLVFIKNSLTALLNAGNRK